MSNPDSTNPAGVSPAFMELLDENRVLRDQLGGLREQVAWLAGRYERDGNVPVESLNALLDGDS